MNANLFMLLICALLFAGAIQVAFALRSFQRGVHGLVPKVEKAHRPKGSLGSSDSCLKWPQTSRRLATQ